MGRDTKKVSTSGAAAETTAAPAEETTAPATTTTPATKKRAIAKDQFTDYQDANPVVIVKGPGITAEGQVQPDNFSDSW